MYSFRYYSHQWRTWGACILQAAWRRHRRRKLADELSRHESLLNLQDLDHVQDYDDDRRGTTALTAALLAKRFAKNTKKGITLRKLKILARDSTSPIPKLFEPTF